MKRTKDRRRKRKSIIEGLGHLSITGRRRSSRASQGGSRYQGAEEKIEEEDGVEEEEEEEEGMDEEESSLKISLWDYGGQKVSHGSMHTCSTCSKS